jgi:hemolysin III
MNKHAYPIREEIANSVTHGLGLLASVVGAAILIALAAGHGGTLYLVSVGIYGISLVALYAASTLYHSFRRPRVKRILKVVDHCAIYLLIAGTYTPFALITLRGERGWMLFGLVWTLAFAGILYKLFFIGRYPRFSTLMYLLMGWLALAVIQPLMTLLTGGAIALLLAGGVAYTAGTLFFHAEARLPYAHAVWHLFVLAGSVCHYFAISLHVLSPVA